jgi:acylphosphatase
LKIVEMKAVVKGHVQGVYFRATVHQHAKVCNISGYARNLENGDVEICAQGSKEDLEALISKIKNEPGRARIDSISVVFQEPQKKYSGFEKL